MQQRLQCLHNADCLLGGLAASEKHVARPPLMDDWLLPAVFPNCAFHVRLYDPFIAQPFITPSYWGGFASPACQGYNAMPAH